MEIRSICRDGLPQLLALYAHLHSADDPLPGDDVVEATWQELMATGYFRASLRPVRLLEYSRQEAMSSPFNRAIDTDSQQQAAPSNSGMSRAFTVHGCAVLVPVSTRIDMAIDRLNPSRTFSGMLDRP